MDSGAGASVIDIGTLKYIGLDKEVKKLSELDQPLINASGNEMDILGVVNIPVTVDNGKVVQQEFKVLNSSHAIILMGQDYMSRYKRVTFDFVNNRVQLSKTWVNGVRIKSKEKVRLGARTTIPARSETMMPVRCSRGVALHSVDFDPVEVKGVPGVFVSKSRVVPDINGVFYLTVLNVNEHDVTLHNRTTVGHVEEMGKTVCKVQVNRASSVIDQVQFGENLTPSERQ